MLSTVTQGETFSMFSERWYCSYSNFMMKSSGPSPKICTLFDHICSCVERVWHSDTFILYQYWRESNTETNLLTSFSIFSQILVKYYPQWNRLFSMKTRPGTKFCFSFCTHTYLFFCLFVCLFLFWLFCRTGGTPPLSPTTTAPGMWWFTTGCFTTDTETFCWWADQRRRGRLEPAGITNLRIPHRWKLRTLQLQSQSLHSHVISINVCW